MGLAKEFKEFVMRGNVMDLAVGVVIGAAFGKIVSSFVNDILMPPIGMLLGGMNFANLKFILKAGSVDAAGKVIEPVTLNYGSFIQTGIDFIIIAFAIFMVIKAVNKLSKAKEEAPPPGPTNEEKLLGEIRDLLAKK